MALRIKSGVSLETIDKWLHQVEDGQSVIDTLLNVKYGKQRLRFNISDFQKIDPSVKATPYRIMYFLNKYFKEHNYPFNADYHRKEEPLYISIRKTRELFHCPVHNIPYKTESNLIASKVFF